ncbi:MAG: type 1 glutamine amidotransferase [Gaiellaceae bacterium]
MSRRTDARARAGAWVGPLDVAEIGWPDVALTAAAADDPVLGVLPTTFPALVWHHYTYGVPANAVELARTERTTQAFRLGDACWGVQFHPEVTAEQLEGWIVDVDDPPPNPDGLRVEIGEHIEAWNELGRTLCRAFLTTVECLLSTRVA